MPCAIPPLCVLALSDDPRSVRVARTAGHIPNASAVRADKPAVKVSTRGSMRAPTIDGSCDDENHAMRSLPHHARRTPAAPPANASSRLSVSNWRITRQRLAPSVRRTETSRNRADARTRRRVARLTHPISRMATATASTSISICLASMRGPSGPCAPGSTRSCGMPARCGLGVSGDRADQLSRTVSAKGLWSSASA